MIIATWRGSGMRQLCLRRALRRCKAPATVPNNVNAVAPGLTLTRLTLPKEQGGEMGIPAKVLEERIARIPFGYAADPQDIANVVLFFASPLSDYITGQCINVSGGMQIP